MATCEDIEPRLSEFVDGDVDTPTRATVSAHLATCERCAGLVVDFERLRSAARSLGPVTPSSAAWTSIAARLASEGAQEPRVAARTAWQWVAAAAAVVLVTGGAYVVQRRVQQTAAPTSAATTAAVTTTDPVSEELALAMRHYDSAIADLQATATSGESKLDPAVAATVKHNLGVIDHAIAESRSAMTEDPTSLAARDSLFDALQQKITVLQDTVALIDDARQPEAPSTPGQLK